MNTLTVDSQTVFLAEIEQLMTVGRLSVMDAVLHWCETRGLEVEYAASLVKKSKVLKQALKNEAGSLHMLKKEQER